MSIKIIPITALRDTQKLEEEVLSSDSPIHITKNGYSSMVIMSEEAYSEGRQTNVQHNVSYPGKVDADLDDPLGFVRVKAAAFPIHLADPKGNVDDIKKQVDEAISEGVSVLCFSELCLTGYTAGDLFLDSTLLDGALSGLKDLIDYSSNKNIAFCVGLPLQIAHKIYNVAALVSNGKLVGIVPKRFIPTYQEFYEGRYFKGYEGDNGYLDLFGERIPFGNRLIFSPSSYPSLKIGIEICEDLWVPNSPSQELSLSGANLILNLSASNETVGKAAYRRDLVGMQSAKLIAAYLYCDAGEGESTTDCVYSAHNIIAENGAILSESKPFAFQPAIAEIDVDKLNAEKRKTNSFDVSSCPSVYFPLRLSTPKNIKRHYARNPFIPEEAEINLDRVNEVMDMQIAGLVGRLKAINCHKVVVGLSGGLDSTLALLVAVEAFKKIGYSLSDITAITLPCFGTSKRTHDNAEELSKDLGVSFKEISIANTVKSHLNDIGHPLDNLNVAYENAQARERTQVLMDVANDTGALMIGTGDLSELCLGWCTYGGDHMSMYGVNASIPKTLVRYLCHGYAIMHPTASKPLMDIINTPISPELLPTKNGEIAQKTEDTIGPYELHDFFIYHFLRSRFSPKKLFFIACLAYDGVYDKPTIKKWLRSFFSRFFHNQFKRSCLPDGPKVGSVAISPRGDWRMPSDADVSYYLKQVDALE